MKALSSRILFLLLLFVVGVFIWVRCLEDVLEKVPVETTENAESPQMVTASPRSDGYKDSLTDSPPEETVTLPAKDVTVKVLESASAGNILAMFSVRELEEIELDLENNVHSHKIKEWKGRLSPGPDEFEELFSEVGSDDSFTLFLPVNTELKIGALRSRFFGTGRGVVTGKMEGDPDGEFVLSYVNHALAGSIRDFRNGMTWEIRNAGNGFQYIAVVDVEKLGVCGVCALKQSGMTE